MWFSRSDWFKTAAAALALVLLGLPSTARAADGNATPAQDGDLWTRDTMLGGYSRELRKMLAEHGITAQLTNSHFYQGVADGGANTHEDRYGGKLDYRVTLDTEKALGLWPGLIFSMHAESRWGRDISADAGTYALPNAPLLYPLPGNDHGTEVTGLLVEQSLLDGRVALFAGKLQSVDLMTTLFPNIGFGLDGFQNVNALATAWTWLRFVNLSEWGGGGFVMDEKTGMVEAAYIVFGTDNVSDTWELTDSFKKGVGMLGVWRLFWDLGGMPGYLLAAGGGATRDYQKLDPHPVVINLTPSTTLIRPGISNEEDKPWAASVYGYQEFWHGDDKGSRKAYVFYGVSLADKKVSFARWNLFGSVEAIGAIPGRDADRMGLAGWFNKINEDLKDLTDELGNRLQDSWGFELYYNVAITPWLHLTADLQLVENENRDDDFAVIPGGRLVIEF